MRIPAGDLAPARRRRYGGTYGRRRTGRALLALVAVGLAGGGAYLLQRDDGKVPSRLTAVRPCATPQPTTPAPRTATALRPGTRLPAPGSFQVLLLNGTPRSGLGKKVGDQLAARAFKVRVIGNAPPLRGASTVSYGPGALPAAMLLSRTVLGSRAVSVPRLAPRQVRLVLGSGYVRLRTPAELAQLARPTTVTVPATPVPATPVPVAPVPAATAGACR